MIGLTDHQGSRTDFITHGKIVNQSNHVISFVHVRTLLCFCALRRKGQRYSSKVCSIVNGVRRVCHDISARTDYICHGIQYGVTFLSHFFAFGVNETSTP